MISPCRLASVLLLASSLAAARADTLTLPADAAEALGMAPGTVVEMQTIYTGRPRSQTFPDKDIVRVDFGNVARHRWLWALHAAQPYVLPNSNLIIYLDADDDPKTGRKDMGCEFMFSHNRGGTGLTAFAPDGSPGRGKAPRLALVEGVLYMCADAEIKQVAGQSRLRVTVLSETREPLASVSSTGWIEVSVMPDSDRPPLALLGDVTRDENFGVTEGLDLVWEAQADPANICFRSPEAQLSNFAYLDAEYRWWAVTGGEGSITVTVPKAGRYYPGVVVYDSRGAEIYELRVDGKRLGAFVAAEDDDRQRLHFLKTPLDFQGGEKLTFRTAGEGSHVTEDLMLLAKVPPVRTRRFAMSHIEAGHVPGAGSGQTRLTWITTWPAACTVEYWTKPGAVKTLTETGAVANHRVYLTGLSPGAKCQYRISAPKPDGSKLTSQPRGFTVAPARAPAGSARRASFPLRVDNPYGFPLRGFPVTNGVPFAKGELGDPTRVRLLDAGGGEVSVQTGVTMRWLDGSVKWLLLTFLADLKPGRTAYTVEYGSQVRRAKVAQPLKLERQGDRIAVGTGKLTATFDARTSGFPTGMRFTPNGEPPAQGEELTPDQLMSLELTDTQGGRFDTRHSPESLEVEEAGPLRAVVKVTGHHQSADGKAFLTYRNRFVFYAGSPLVRLYTTWGNDQPEAFATLNQLSLQVPMSGDHARWAVGLGDGQVARGQGPLSLSQLRDDAFTLDPAPAVMPAKQRADGWLDVSGERFGLLTVVRDFWQLYPKGLRLGPAGVVSLDLCPDFPAGTYDGCSRLDGIKLYYYLMGGQYKLRQGMTKQHEIILWPHVAAAGEEPRQVAQACQDPPLAICAPERYCDTRVFGEVLPATTGRWPEYEQVCEEVYQGYVGGLDRSHEYGMMNFGDRWGERRVNWANGEYDHHHAFLMQFIRCADPKWYRLGDRAARHAIDVDTAHHGLHRGGEWIHAMGHTGQYFDEQYEGEGITGGGFSPSHTWTEGFSDWYALSGDPTAAENAALVADHYDGAYLNDYDFSNCRDNGWHLLLTLAAFRATGDPYYLNAARIIVERTLERQSPGGGWHRQMVPGHCLDMPRHRGEANFMLGVLANGLEEYYHEVGDQRVAEAIKGGARQAVAEMWVPEVDGFRYTSCPNMTGYVANNDMTAEVLFFAYRVGGAAQYGEIAMRAMRAAFKDGIGSISHLRWTPHLLYNMDLLAREGLSFAPQESVRIALRHDQPGDLTLRLSGSAKWATLARLRTPEGHEARPDDTGLLTLPAAPAGYYLLTVTKAPVAWQLHTSVRRWAADASGGLVLQVGKSPSLIRYQKSAKPSLSKASGAFRVVGGPVIEDGVAASTVSGPGRCLVKAAGSPWVAVGGEWLNPSAPAVRIEGPASIGPGRRTARYTARAWDLDNDITAYEWLLPGNREAAGPEVEVEFAAAGLQQLAVTVRDRQGNSASATISVSTPPPDLAALPPERVVTLQAEDFADQGLDAVQLFERIGSQGKMLSYWDATTGHWLEWEVTIATTGDYAIYLRYCSGAPQPPRRSLQVNGKSPGSAFDEMTMPLTGGFCTATDDWAYYAAAGGETVHLGAGKHRLRLTNLGGGVGLDCIVLVRR